ncbi:MAG: hypothetical protein CMI79_06510 [Candidatus Pelagibacter sp.]|nr:hypothetical protein [Candidatus Pelagibacter sp.]
MLEREEKTKIINGMSQYIEDLVGDKKYGGWLVVAIHNIIVITILTQVFYCNSKIEVCMGAMIWLLLVGCHLLFNGCILVRLERNLFESKEWYNVWHLLFSFADLIGYSLTHKNFIKAQSTIGILLTCLVVWKAYKVCITNEKKEKRE